MGKRIRYTEEQLQFFRSETLQGLREGIAINEIARNLGFSDGTYISRLKNKLIAEGAITQAEIDEKRDEVLNKKRAEKESLAGEKAKDKLERKIQDRRMEILRLLQQGKTKREIEKELKIPATTINRDVAFLIENGLIKEEEIIRQEDKNSIERAKKIERIKTLLGEGMNDLDIALEVGVSESLVEQVKYGTYEKYKEMYKAKPSRKKVKFYPNPENIQNLTPMELAVYNELRRGYQYAFIDKKLGLTREQRIRIVENLNVMGVLSRQDIREARERLMAEDTEYVYQQIKKGYTQAEMIRRVEHFNGGEVARIFKRLKDEGRITQEEIDAAKERERREYEKLVADGMDKGLTISEIIDSDKTGYLTKAIVRSIESSLIERGEKNPKKVQRKNQRRKKIQREDEKKDYDDKFIELFKKRINI